MSIWALYSAPEPKIYLRIVKIRYYISVSTKRGGFGWQTLRLTLSHIVIMTKPICWWLFFYSWTPPHPPIKMLWIRQCIAINIDCLCLVCNRQWSNIGRTEAGSRSKSAAAGIECMEPNTVSSRIPVQILRLLVNVLCTELPTCGAQTTRSWLYVYYK